MCVFSSFLIYHVHAQVLEKHLIELLNRLDAFEHVREQLEMQERPSSLIESRDSVRRHVDAQDIISKVDTITNMYVLVVRYVCVYMYMNNHVYRNTFQI